MLISTHRKDGAPSGVCLGLTHAEPRPAEIVIVLARGDDARYCVECAESAARLLFADVRRARKEKKGTGAKNASGNKKLC